MIRSNASGEAVIGFERDGQPMSGTTNTTVQARPTSDTDLTLTEVGFLGVTAESHIAVTNGGPLYTLEQMGSMTQQTVQALVHLPAKVWGVAKAIVGVEERSLDSPVSIVGGGRIAGETASHDDFALSEKVVFLLMLVAGLQPLHRAVQLHPAAAARRRSHRRGAVGGHPPRHGPALADAPTPGTSTSPSCCRSPTPSRRCCS